MHKGKLLFLLLFFAGTLKLPAQEIFVIDGEPLELRTEVKGPLTLLWTVEDQNYRYFVQKGNRVIELKNTKKNRAYKKQLKKLLGEEDLKLHQLDFLLYDLKHFVNRYNAKIQEDYRYNTATPNIFMQIGFFMGLSNNKYTSNPENILVPVIGVGLEFHDPNLAPRHAVFLQLQQTFRQDEYQYSSTRLSFNYKFKILNFRNFNLHIATNLVTFLYAGNEKNIIGSMGEIIGSEREYGFSFTAPLSFGLGSAIKITEESYITFAYNDIFSLVLDGNGHFPIDFTVGYKYNL